MCCHLTTTRISKTFDMWPMWQKAKVKKHLQTNYKKVHSKACSAKHIRAGCPWTRKKKCPTCFRLLLLQTIKTSEKGLLFQRTKNQGFGWGWVWRARKGTGWKKKINQKQVLRVQSGCKGEEHLLDEEHRKANSHLCPEEENHAKGFFENR